MPQLIFETCQVEGCERPHKARGYCAAHYQQFLRGIPIKVEIREKMMAPPLICTEPGCGQPEKSKGLCGMHYARLLRHGHTKRPNRQKEFSICTVEGCDQYHYAKGLCHLHYMRKRKLIEDFGITVDQYDAMMAAQDNKCAICATEVTRLNWRSGKPEALSVDHDHKTQAIRGLLCDTCNRAIGLLGDDIERVRSALAYLERHKPPE